MAKKFTMIRLWRLTRRKTLAQLADETGIPEYRLRLLETDPEKGRLTYAEAAALARALKVKVDRFVELERDGNEEGAV